MTASKYRIRLQAQFASIHKTTIFLVTKISLNREILKCLAGYGFGSNFIQFADFDQQKLMLQNFSDKIAKYCCSPKFLFVELSLACLNLQNSVG